jgi:hypothetical protein
MLKTWQIVLHATLKASLDNMKPTNPIHRFAFSPLSHLFSSVPRGAIVLVTG